MKFKVGTRGSKLALIQTQLVIDALKQHAPDAQVDIAIIKTEGDRNRNDSLTTLGGRGVFVRDIEERLLAGEIDCAVHSLKDLPTTQPDGLRLVAVLERADPRDAFVSAKYSSLQDLPHGAHVGSSSLRRAAQLLTLRPDLRISDIRGNVDTRLRKLDEGEYDAIVLAAAGLMRMNLQSRITQIFTLDEMLPAVAQGALVVECRADDARMSALLALLDHAPTRAAITAERAFLRALGGGCQLPIAAYAEIDGNELCLRGLVSQPDGQRCVRDTIRGETKRAQSLGAQLAERVMANGARELMETSALTPNPSPKLGEGRRGEGKPLTGKRIAVTRAREQAAELSEKLRALGALPIEVPMIEIAPPADFAPLDDAIKHIMRYDWLVFSSANGVKYFWQRLEDCQLRLPRIAAVGPKTAEALRANGLRVDAMPAEYLASELASALGEMAGQRILLLQPDSAPSDLGEALRARGALVEAVVAYRTLPASNVQLFTPSDIDVITFASASAATNFARVLNGQTLPSHVCVACIGPSTAQAARDAGLRVDVVAPIHTLDGLVSSLVEHFQQS